MWSVAVPSNKKDIWASLSEVRHSSTQYFNAVCPFLLIFDLPKLRGPVSPIISQIKMHRSRQLLMAHPGPSMTTNLPAQQNYGHSKTDNWNRMAWTEQPMSIIHLTHTFWQRSGGFSTALASWRSHGQCAQLSHIHIPATDSRWSLVHFSAGPLSEPVYVFERVSSTRRAYVTDGKA